MSIVSWGWAVTGFIVLLTLSRGFMLAVFLPVAIVLFHLQLHYRRSAVDLQRLDAVSRSPLQQLVDEAVTGSRTIRAFGRQAFFLQRLRGAIDRNTEALLCWTAAQRWIGIRMDFGAACIAVGAAVSLALFRDVIGITPGFAGMLMTWAFHQVITFMYLVTSFTGI